MHKIAEFKAENGKKTKVYWNADYSEYVVRFFNHKGVHMDASDYFTNDKKDALNTAKIAVEAR